MPFRKKDPNKRGTRGTDLNQQLYGRAAKALEADGSLPLCEDVDLAVERHMAVTGCSEKAAIRATAAEVRDIWQRTTKIQVSADKAITRKILSIRAARKRTIMENSIDLRRNKKRFANSKGHMKRGNHQKVSKLTLDDVKETLFDISSVKFKIPRPDQKFYDDQKGPRVLKVKVLDVVNHVSPIPGPSKSSVSPSLISNSGDTDTLNSEDEDEMEVAEEERDPDFVPPNGNHQSRQQTRGSRKSINPQLFAVSDRRGFSVRAATDSHNLHNPQSKVSVSTMFYARKQARFSAVPDYTGHYVICISIDERIDSTLSGSGVFEKEEHCSVVLYCSCCPGAIQAGHFVPPGGTGKDLILGLLRFCHERNICLDNLSAIITDGCNKMVGWFTGAHSILENILGRPLQRLVCFFHHLEKSFEGSFAFNGFKSNSGTSLAEPWRSLISGDIHKKEVIEFEVIENPNLLSLLKSRNKSVKLSNDHEIILGLAEVVVTGNKESKFVHRRIGPINLARFTTSEARILRCYLSTLDPEEYLVNMMRFLIFVWLPVFIHAKCHQSIGFCGPDLLLLEVKLAKLHLSFEHFEAVKDRIDWNGQFAHHENVLLAMLCSESPDQRLVAVEVISEVRSKPVPVSANAKQRLFTRDDWKVNEYAQSLSNLSSVPLFDCKTEPPMTKHLSNAELESLIDLPLKCSLPLTTVATERAVKETTRVSKMGASGPRERDGIMALSRKARENSKK